MRWPSSRLTDRGGTGSVVPMGYSKTTDVAALLIVLLMLLPNGSECAAAAHRTGTRRRSWCAGCGAW